MISEIAIKNLAIIDDIRIRFEKGLNILTGETGAGKSIIINAINLILGNRASSKMIRTGEESAEVEALFEIEQDSLTWQKLKENDFSPEDGLIIRRIIARNNRHKVYINQRLSTAQILNEITQNLASVSGQHEHQSLLDEKNNIFFLDNYAGLKSDVEKVKGMFIEVNELEDKLIKLKNKKKSLEKDLELNNFQVNEIESANLLDPMEDSKLERTVKKMLNAKRLIEISQSTSSILYSGSNSVSETMATVKKEIESASKLDENFLPFLHQLESVYAEITDLGQSIINYLDEIETDEEQLLLVEQRLEAINRLKQKYGNSIEDVLNFYGSIKNRTSDFETINSKIDKTKEKIDSLWSKFFDLSSKLSKKRQKASKELASVITQSVRELEMPHADFFTDIKSRKEFLNETGIDKIDFLIAANPGESAKPIAQTASGGELSRLILAIKSATAKTGNVSTIIFDEADAGIGGQAAEKTGEKIKQLSKSSQIICITHLPQISKFADHHYFIEKNVSKNRTRTSIKKLTKQERVNEIARMISGENITDKTIDHAKELIDKVS